jgi:hypothetical protein
MRINSSSFFFRRKPPNEICKLCNEELQKGGLMSVVIVALLLFAIMIDAKALLWLSIGAMIVYFSVKLATKDGETKK